MDVGRRPYRTVVRPFRDSDTEVTIHWYVVPKTNPVLPFPSRINSLDWRPFGLNPSPRGEVSFADRDFDGWNRIVPPLPQDHICGERIDFEDGGLINADAPPLDRDVDGIPSCCRPKIGGVAVGGSFPVFRQAGAVQLSGGGARQFNTVTFLCVDSPFIDGTEFVMNGTFSVFSTVLMFARPRLFTSGRRYRIRGRAFVLNGTPLTDLQILGGSGCDTGDWSISLGPGPAWDAVVDIGAGVSPANPVRFRIDGGAVGLYEDVQAGFSVVDLGPSPP